MSRFTRRAFLAALGAAACSPLVEEYTQPGLPDDLQPPGGSGRHPIAHLLHRATYGPRPGQIQQVEAMGRAAWLERQFDYENIDEWKLDLRLRRYDSLKFKPQDLISFKSGEDKDYIRGELLAVTLQRAIYSERQLHEVMVGFWSDHFNIYHFKGSAATLKTADDRDVIRPHALGNFADLLTASARSPAMLVYLDNVLNEQSHPNENYAREIMELHTLGVDGGYGEQDIQEVARCFTGWSVNGRGEFVFISEWHDDGEKHVLGHTIRADRGKEDGERVLEILLAHPSTPRFVCSKLARRFVADEPSESLVNDLVAAWTASDGDIKTIMRTIFDHPEFENAPPKLKRPFELLVSLLRATNAEVDGGDALVFRLDQLGHRPFAFPTPDGYPDTAQEWSGNLLGRWNLGVDALSGALPGVGINVDDLAEAGGVDDDFEARLAFFGRLFVNRDLDTSERDAILSALENDDEDRLVQALGLLMASPAFQWR